MPTYADADIIARLLNPTPMDAPRQFSKPPEGFNKPPEEEVPMPQADPRGSTFSQRLPKGRMGNPYDPSIISPEMLQIIQGLNPSRKNGDAIDYNADDMAGFLANWPMEKGI